MFFSAAKQKGAIRLEEGHDSPPLRISFERKLKQLQLDVYRMGALVEGSCQLADQALFERNLDAAAQIRVQDKKIDSLYRQIEEECVNLIALQSPVAHDLRLLSSIMQLVRDLERIGDYAKNLADVAIRLVNYENPPHLQRVQAMSKRCKAQLATALSTLSNLDLDAAQRMSKQDDVIDSDYESLYTLLTQETEVNGVVEPIVLMVLAIRHLERMADHATNIGKRVAYIVTGERGR
jgi:phosphate transport system protein